MDIAAMSMNMASSRIQMQMSMSVAKKAMDSEEMIAEGLNKMLEAVDQMMPPSNHLLDVRA